MGSWRRSAGAVLAFASFAMVASAGVGRAAEHVMRLMTDAPQGRFSFEPPILFAAVGDGVRLVPSSRLHAVKSIAGMLPEGVKPWRGRMGEEVQLRLDTPGVYGLKCSAHYQIGMVALIVVGDARPNWDAARAVRHPPLPAGVLDRLFNVAACRLHLAQRTGCDEAALRPR
jgi:pseudoazurin